MHSHLSVVEILDWSILVLILGLVAGMDSNFSLCLHSPECYVLATPNSSSDVEGGEVTCLHVTPFPSASSLHSPPAQTHPDPAFHPTLLLGTFTSFQASRQEQREEGEELGCDAPRTTLFTARAAGMGCVEADLSSGQ